MASRGLRERAGAACLETTGVPRRRGAGPAVEGGMVVVVKMATRNDALLTRPAAWRGNTVKGFAWLGNHHPHPPKPQAFSRPC
jgi:hypothetical protein